MKCKWKLHPSDYALGENEKFYSDMEAKGWRLVKRGTYRSKFEQVESSRARYRVEVVKSDFLEPDDGTLPEAQISVYEDCGWEYVASRRMLHFFRALEGSNAPEFYQEPQQQAETLKGVRRSLFWNLAISIALIALMAPMVVMFCGGTPRFLAQMRRLLVAAPGLPGFYFLFILWSLVGSIIDVRQISRTYRRLKQGIPLDHEPKGRGLIRMVLDRGLWMAAILCLVLVQLATMQRGDMPSAPDGPYIVLSAMGWEGERSDFMGNTSYREHTCTVLSEYWNTREYVENPGQVTVAIYQEIYHLSSWFDPREWVQSLTVNQTFVKELDEYIPVEIEGLDAAWLVEDGMEAVAVKGQMLAYISYLDGASAQNGSRVFWKHCQIAGTHMDKIHSSAFDHIGKNRGQTGKAEVGSKNDMYEYQPQGDPCGCFQCPIFDKRRF